MRGEIRLAMALRHVREPIPLALVQRMLLVRGAVVGRDFVRGAGRACVSQRFKLARDHVAIGFQRAREWELRGIMPWFGREPREAKECR